MSKKDYYEVLGVSKSATAQEIKSAYKRLAKKYHPDVSKSADAEAKFKEVGEAYEVLSNTEKRAAYDQLGHAAFDPGAGAGFSRRAGPSVDFSDFFGGFRDPFDIFEEFFGASSFGFGTARTRRPPQSRRGSDLLYELALTFSEAAKGVEKEIVFERAGRCKACGATGSRDKDEGTIVCTACNGQGQVQKTQKTLLGAFATVATCSKCNGSGRVVKNPCNECGGSGQRLEKKNLKIKVPPGADSGNQLRFSGEGNAGERGAATGDLYVRFRVGRHKVLKRQGANLYLELPINFTQAVLGDVVEVPTVDKKVKFKIPPHTQTNTRFCLKGKGLVHFGKTGRGDLYITVNVRTPLRLRKKERELFNQLKELEEKPQSLLDKLFG